MYHELRRKSFLCVCLLCRRDTVRVIARWRRPVAPREALVVIYRPMRAALHHHIRMVIEMAR